MPRLKDGVHAYFGAPYDSASRKTKLCRCSFCDEEVTASAHRMKSHLNAQCKKKPRSVGQFSSVHNNNPVATNSRSRSARSCGSGVDAGVLSLPPANPSAAEQVELQQARGFIGKREQEDGGEAGRFSLKQQEKIELLIAKAIHVHGLPFDLFDNEEWRQVWVAARPQFRLPGPEKIGGELLNKMYEEVQGKTMTLLAQASMLGISIDSTTNVARNGRSSGFNVMVNTPIPYLLEFMALDVERETASTLFERVIDLLNRLDQTLRTDFKSTIVREVWGFVTDSPNVMFSLRRQLSDSHLQLDERQIFMIAYGCPAHAFNNFVLDCLNLPILKDVLKKSVFIVNTVNRVPLIDAHFKKIQGEVLGEVLSLTMFSKTRWTSAQLMILRLLQTRVCLIQLCSASLEGNLDVEIPQALQEVLMNRSYWDRLSAASKFLMPICAVTGHVEGDSVALSTVYACFVYLKLYILSRNSEEAQVRHEVGIGSTVQKYLFDKLVHRFERIMHPVHALLFTMDPFYDGVRHNLTVNQLSIGRNDVMELCRNAIKLFSQGDSHLHELMLCEFTLYCERFMNRSYSDHLTTMKEMHPSLIWTQGASSCPVLAPILVKCFKLTGAAGGERLFKLMNRAHSKERARTSSSLVEKQTAVGFNSRQLDRHMENYRRTALDVRLSSMYNPLDPGSDSERLEERIATRVEEFITEDISIQHETDALEIDRFENPGQISDTSLFGEVVES